MQQALRKFAIDESSASPFIYHRLLGHDMDEVLYQVNFPKHFHAPNLPELNRSQVFYSILFNFINITISFALFTIICSLRQWSVVSRK